MSNRGRKQHIRYIRLKKWFPEDDALSTQMARLCILREDFLFELRMGVESKSLPMGDDHRHTWRLLYFFRRMSNTVTEIQTVLERMSANADFKYLLQAQGSNFKNGLKKYKANLRSALDTIKTIRNDTAAHILETSLHQAIKNMDYSQSGFLQISFEDIKDTHYRFTEELLTAIMFKDTPPQDQEKKAIEIIEKFLGAIEGLLLWIDQIFSAYIGERHLNT
jgi:hypothetical protein